MNTAAQRSARGALDAARPALARLNPSRGSEDLAADLIELWSAAEAALRSLVGSSTLTGQPLIREARQRQLIDFDVANSLAELQAVHDRLQNTSYHATPADIDAGRNAFTKLDVALTGDAGTGPAFGAPRPPAQATAATAAAAAAAVAAVADRAPPPAIVKTARPIPVWLAAVVLLAVIGLGIGGYFMFRGGTSSLQQGADAYRAGQREVAVSAFTRASRENPKDPLPHIYLARMAREVGNFTLASEELQKALEADPADATALREMGANLLAQGNYELARRFYVRAVQADPTDKTSMGYLGCTLMRLNRPTDAANFLTRAGQGPWSNCQAATSVTPVTPLTK